MNYPSRPLRSLIGAFAALLTLTSAAGTARAVDIGAMAWTQRSDWINVKNCSAVTHGPNAVGNGVADDTAAIQGVLTYLQANDHPTSVTAYFPPGTYKISNTLTLASRHEYGLQGVSLIGCGSRTVMKWAEDAPIGAAMFAPDGTDHMRYIGFVWDGSNRAGCGIELNTTGKLSHVPTYETQILNENESFRNFTINGTYAPMSPGDPPTIPGAGIAQGFGNSGEPTSEVLIHNCCFSHCAAGILTAYSQHVGNNYVWQVDGCEFDHCGAGINFPHAGDYMVTNTHFQQTVGADIAAGSQGRIRHCSSEGSGTFFAEGSTGSPSPNVLQDCWVDNWTGVPNLSSAAVTFARLGPNVVFDCVFTHPPKAATGAIHNNYNNFPPPPFPGGVWASLMLSNNAAPAFPSGYGIMDSGSSPAYHLVVPPGQRGGMVSSPSQTFLRTDWPADSVHVIDVTQAPYKADRNGSADCAAAVQSAINAARTAHNGAIVYFPIGTYKIASTLHVSGGDYSLQGSGIRSELTWAGPGNTPLLAIANPQNIGVKSLDIWDPYQGIIETAAGPSRITYDDLHLQANYGGTGPGTEGQGLVLFHLPVGSVVSLGEDHVDLPLTVVDCGAAQILANVLYLDTDPITVSGTGPKTGFLGVMLGEGGQKVPGQYNITISDNQDFVMADYYTEQSFNDLDLERGNGTGTGRVTIQGLNSGANAAVTSIKVNDYAGRLFYGSQQFASAYGNRPVEILHAGTNPCDMILAGDVFFSGLKPITPGPGAHLLQTLDVAQSSDGVHIMPDIPNPPAAADLASLAASLDHLRQLMTVRAAQQSGLAAYWKLDETSGGISRDDSLSGLHGQWINHPAFAAAHPAPIVVTDPGGLACNGVNQYVRIPPSAMLPAGKAPRTLCAWAKANTLTGGSRCIAAFGAPSTGQAMFLGMRGTSLWAGGYGSDFSVPNFWDTKWHFLALTYDGATARLYADGVLRASSARNWNLTPSACYIGAQAGGRQYWNGLIDDVRIYSRALSPEDIAALAGK